MRKVQNKRQRHDALRCSLLLTRKPINSVGTKTTLPGYQPSYLWFLRVTRDHDSSCHENFGTQGERKTRTYTRRHVCVCATFIATFTISVIIMPNQTPQHHHQQCLFYAVSEKGSPCSGGSVCGRGTTVGLISGLLIRREKVLISLLPQPRREPFLVVSVWFVGFIV